MNDIEDDEQLEPGFILGKYRIVRFISEGSMGRVYEAEHTILHSRHALKVIRKFLAMNQYFISKFRYEARLMAALEHENIVRVTDYGQDKGYSFFVLDFIRGPNGEPLTLQSEINRQAGKPMEEDQVQQMALQTCEALAYAHSFRGEGIVHRDLKPGNILLRDVGKKDLRVVVTDFGLARMLSVDDNLQSMVVLGDGAQGTIVVSDEAGVKIKTDEISGTPAYMAPEQWTPGAEIGPASDIYSLGVILYKQLTGEMPFIDSRSLLGERNEGPLAKPSSFGVSKDWDPIVAKCLEAKPSDRWTTAAELRDAIEAIGAKKESSGLAGKMLGLLLVAGILAAGAWAFMQHQKDPEQSLLSTFIPATPTPTPVVTTAVVEAPTPVPVPPTPTPVPEIETGLVELALAHALGDRKAPYLPPTARLRSGNEPWKIISFPHVLEWPLGSPLELELEVKGFSVSRPALPEVSADEQQKVVFEVAPKKVPLKLTSNVGNAKIFMSGELVGKVGGTLELEPFRNLVLEVRAEGYNTEQVFLDQLDPARDYAPRHAPLTEIPAQLQIIGHYPSVVLGDRKVNVFLNDKHIGMHTLPHTLYNMKPGEYSVRIEGDNWQALPAQKIDLERAGSGRIEFKFTYKQAKLALKTSPTDASVYIGGALQKERKLDLEPGLYKIQVAAETYETKVVAVNLRPGESEDLTVKLDRMTLFDFKITPPDATIYMKGKKINAQRIRVQPNTSYLVTIRKDGYKTHQGTYKANKGELKVIELKMKRKFF